MNLPLLLLLLLFKKRLFLILVTPKQTKRVGVGGVLYESSTTSVSAFKLFC